MSDIDKLINIWVYMSKWGVTLCALAGAYNIHFGRNDADKSFVFAMAGLAIFFWINSPLLKSNRHE